MLRFGVSAFSTTTATGWRDDARRLEAAGFDTFWCADHVGYYDPFVALTAAASATERMRVGTYVLNAGLWNPLLLARAVSTTGQLTDGRLTLGLGAGHAKVEFEQAGLRYPPASERVDRLAALVPALRRLLAGETVDDPALGLVGAATGLGPVDVPLLVGGNGDRVLDLAGREADAAGLVGVTSGTGQVHTDRSHWDWDGLAERIAHVRSAAAGRGLGADLDVDVLVQRVDVGDEPSTVLDELRGFGLADDELDSPFLLIGSEGAVVEKLDRMHDLGVTGVTAFSRDADALIPVMAQVRDT